MRLRVARGDEWRGIEKQVFRLNITVKALASWGEAGVLLGLNRPMDNTLIFMQIHEGVGNLYNDMST
jgi:hypothetical protein